MFEQTFVDGVGTTKRPYTILVSFLIQLAALAIIVIIPLIYFDALPNAQLATFLTAPPPPAPPPPPPPPQAVKVVKVAPKQFDMGKLTAPKTVPKEIKMIVESEEPPSAVGVIGGVLGGLLGGMPAPPPPPPPPPPAKPKPPAGPQRIGGDVTAAKLIRKTVPAYPPLAKAARVQ